MNWAKTGLDCGKSIATFQPAQIAQNCVMKPAAKTVFNPCVQQHEAYRHSQDPYYQHMPKHDAAAATLYSAQMGGEHHEPADCDLM
jgi:hypothetical protein